jgi:hypothetical protein
VNSLFLQGTGNSRQLLDARKLRGDDGVLIPVRISGYAPTWLRETRIYFDLTSRTIAELIGILLRITAGREMTLSSVTSQDDLHRALPGTTWRKRNGIEHVIFRNAGLFYNNHAGYPIWRENYYRIESAFGRMTLTWTVDNFTTGCVLTIISANSPKYEIQKRASGPFFRSRLILHRGVFRGARRVRVLSDTAQCLEHWPAPAGHRGEATCAAVQCSYCCGEKPNRRANRRA